MGVIFLIVATVTNSLSYVFEKYFTKKCIFLFTAIAQFLCAMAFLAMSKFQLSFNPAIWGYALSIMVLATINACALNMAVQRGDLSITGLLSSLSLIVTTLLSIFFLNGKPSIYFIIGFFVLIVAMVLINVPFEKKKEKKEKRKFDVLWLILSLLALFANGVSSFLVAKQESVFDGQYNNEIMIIAFALSSIVTLIISFIFEKGEKINEGGKSALLWGCLCGAALGIMNVFVLLSVAEVHAAIVFPVISGGSMMLIFLASLLFFKEKYRETQYVGFILSIVSLVLLSL